MKSPIKIEPGGNRVWHGEHGDRYEVTGVNVYGKRFKVTCMNWGQARAINLWRGTKWLVRGGRRYKILETWNG